MTKDCIKMRKIPFKSRKHNFEMPFFKLPLKLERIKAILHLKGVYESKLSTLITPPTARLIYKWIDGTAEPKTNKYSTEALKNMALALDIPMEFFFYEKVEIKIENGKVYIYIVDPEIRFEFYFLT